MFLANYWKNGSKMGVHLKIAVKIMSIKSETGNPNNPILDCKVCMKVLVIFCFF